MRVSPMKYLNNIDSFLTPYTGRGVTHITSFGQNRINGLAGTSDPDMQTTNPDDKLEVGYKRISRDMNPTNKILWEKPKRRWRKRREEKRRKNKEKIKTNKKGDILEFK